MKLSIIGVGRVGVTLAYTLILKQRIDELVLVGRNLNKCRAEALDLTHAQLLVGNRVKINSGDINTSANSDIVVVTASTPVRPEMPSRFEIARENIEIYKTLLPQIIASSPNAILLIISNPVDIMTYAAIKFSGLPRERVIGTGTLIDSARFRASLAAQVRIHPFDLRAYILGEHGDTQFPFFSEASAGGEKMEITPERIQMFEETKRVGYEVHQKKGYTNFAVATAADYIIESIAEDKHYTIPISYLVDGFLGVKNVCLSLPAVVGTAGIEQFLKPNFSPDEQSAFKHSAATLATMIQQLGL